MGMAASQARFLNLTARKTNIEYQGQQINQQRTVLSNESANLYNQMLVLSVPTPPNTNDYTKVEYTFTVPGSSEEATISQVTKVKGTDNQYTVAYSYVTTEDAFNVCPTTNQVSVASNKVNFTDDRYTSTKTYQTYQITTSSGKTVSLYKYENDATNKIHEDAYKSTDICNGSGEMYIANVGTNEKPIYQYFKGTELEKARAATAASDKKCSYYTAGTREVPKSEYYTPCIVTRDKQNRITGFTYTPTSGNNQDFAVTTKTVTDDAAYNDAMNEYTYQNYLYEQEMNNINARTSIIQAQDKELELKLKQLDTEHNAVQTEMESVQSVVKKNSEDSFKTFA